MLSKCERNYTTEKELLSIETYHKFQSYLLGNTVVVWTDHQALTFLQNYRLTRWLLVLQVEHCNGKDNGSGKGWQQRKHTRVVRRKDKFRKECS